MKHLFRTLSLFLLCVILTVSLAGAAETEHDTSTGAGTAVPEVQAAAGGAEEPAQPEPSSQPGVSGGTEGSAGEGPGWPGDSVLAGGGSGGPGSGLQDGTQGGSQDGSKEGAPEGTQMNTETETAPGTAAETTAEDGTEAASEDLSEGQTESPGQEESEMRTGPVPDPMFGLLVGQEITIQAAEGSGFGAEGMLSAAAASSKTIKVKIVAEYNYDHAGLGDGTNMLTHAYQVTYNGTKTIAYCLQPARGNPSGSEKFTISKLSDGQTAAKVMYYAQADAAHGGYFATKHPKYSKEKQFIITHMAVAKASGASSWALRANSKGKSEAKALIKYAESMEDLPDASISFSPQEVNSREEDGVMKTDQVIFSAANGNTGTVTLPQGVSLQNLTDSSRSGTGSVTLLPGDTFTLSCALPLPSGYSAEASAVGKMTKDYSAYKIKTDKDTQDLGLIFAEGASGQNEAQVKAYFSPEVEITPCKTDRTTGNPLEGASFGLFAGEEMTESDGSARTADELIEQVSTDASGTARFTHHLTIGLPYYVREIRAPEGYRLNGEDRMEVVFESADDSSIPQVAEHTFVDDPILGEIHLYKRDRDLMENPGNEEDGTSAGSTGSPDAGTPGTQGDASLKGAVYGLYAREDILHPDRSGTVLYSAGGEVARGTTDEAGGIVWRDLYPGRYYVREISPSEGYVLNETEYDVELKPGESRAEEDADPVLRADITVPETVIRQPFSLEKRSGSDDAPSVPLEGAGFTAWLLSSLKPDGDSWDVSGAQPAALCADGSAEMFTDREGHAVSVPLPYGTYLVRETTVPANHIPVREFLVRISENHPDTPQEWIVLTDEQLQAKLRITKKDAQSGQTILKAGAKFRVWSETEERYTGEQTDSAGDGGGQIYETDGSGTLLLPGRLKAGTYRIEEVQAPEGYRNSSAPVTVKIDENEPLLDDPQLGCLVAEAVVTDEPVTGRLELVKRGPMLTGYDGKHFIYEERGLAGACFDVIAQEDIPRPDAQKDENGEPVLLYRKGETAARLKTDSSGSACAEGLPLGRYKVIETAAPYGCAKVSKEYPAALEADGESAVVTLTLEITDPRQTLDIRVEKSSTDGSRKKLKGAEFTLYAAEDIHARSEDGETPGAVLVRAGEAVSTAVSTAEGSAAFSEDLPHAAYYIRETKAPEGYEISDRRIDCDGTYKNGDLPVLSILKKVSDRPLKKVSAQTGGGAGKAPVTGDRTPLVPLLLCALASLAAGIYCVLTIRRMW